VLFGVVVAVVVVAGVAPIGCFLGDCAGPPAAAPPPVGLGDDIENFPAATAVPGFLVGLAGAVAASEPVAVKRAMVELRGVMGTLKIELASHMPSLCESFGW
jgi:hypothetical protein